MKKLSAALILTIATALYSEGKEKEVSDGFIFKVVESVNMSPLKTAIPKFANVDSAKKVPQNFSKFEKEYMLFACPEGALTKSGKNSENLASAYYPGKFQADILDGQKTANILPVSPNGLDLSAASILSILSDPKRFISRLEECAKASNLKITPKMISYEDNGMVYVILIERKKFSSFEILDVASGEKLAKIELKYRGDQNIFPDSIDIFGGAAGKELKKNCKVHLLKSGVRVPKELFACSSMGIYKFTDLRFATPQTYNYDGGLPTFEDAKIIVESMRFKDIKEQMDASWESLAEKTNSEFFKNLAEFFGKFDGLKTLEDRRKDSDAQ